MNIRALRGWSCAPAFLLLFSVFPVNHAFAQDSTHQGLPVADPLYKTIAGLDTALFDAYNTCNLEKFGSMIAEDLEFYHDQAGASYGRAPFMATIKANICGKVHRELVPGTLEVYPIKDYGAVEIGIHCFSHIGDPHPEQCGKAKFVTLWQLKDGAWKITRALSFDHH
ncbi:MAG TPA: nuclear transport factor 2 family protein [Terracidiphilus sp.]|nr:nuclear transport factor 2 family protein [Terracidiphilus sp.]